MILCLILSLLLAVSNMNRERTVITPPVVRDTFWIDSSDASDQYLQEMATYFVLLTSNVSPSNVEYQNKLFLNYVNPAEQGSLKQSLDKQAQRIKRNNITTMFYITGFKINSEANKVIVMGQMNSLIGDKLVSNKGQAFRVSFKIINGKLYIDEFGMVKPDNPWGEIINEDQ